MRTRTFLCLAALLGFLSLPAFSDDAPQAGIIQTSTKTWTDTGEFSVVSTNGNSRATTTSAKDSYTYNVGRALLSLGGGALGSSSGNQVTAEQYNAAEKVAWTLVNKDYVFEHFAWDSNRFAGYRNRYDIAAGLGRVLFALPKDTLSTEVGPGYINEQRIDSPRNDFLSGRVYAKYVHAFTSNSAFTQEAEYLHDFSDRKDYRLNTDTALIAGLTTHLALKASFSWKRVGLPPVGVGKDDTTTSMALVVNY